MRLTDDTAKLRRSMGVEAAVGRRATAGRRNLEAMVAAMVRCVADGGRALLDCVRRRAGKDGGFN